MSGRPATITALLAEWRSGNPDARDHLIVAVYDELRRLAAPLMHRERHDHILQTTALVHEAYIRLCGTTMLDIRDRGHLFALLARQMRRILVDAAREARSEKRWGGLTRVALDDVSLLEPGRSEELLAVDEALTRLRALDDRIAQVVELRYFGGLTEREAADALGVSVSTVKRDWEFARAWLVTQLRSAEPEACD
jgi:RNA polymerase sigma factor (TIGR02999 family)